MSTLNVSMSSSLVLRNDRYYVHVLVVCKIDFSKEDLAPESPLGEEKRQKFVNDGLPKLFDKVNGDSIPQLYSKFFDQDTKEVTALFVGESKHEPTSEIGVEQISFNLFCLKDQANYLEGALKLICDNLAEELKKFAEAHREVYSIIPKEYEFNYDI